MDFAQAEKLFRDDKIQELASHSQGLRYLKLRSLSRRDHLDRLFRMTSISPVALRAQELFREAYEAPAIDAPVIDATIRAIYEEQRNARRDSEPELVDNLYQMQVFDWGGLHQNSLEKTIVDNYVKRITDYDVLCGKIEDELHKSMRGYVLCSWYNHWTSIIIEDVFRDHPNVLPAIGQVKKIDFFIANVPFDLKVTYLPEGFVKKCRRDEGRQPELTLLRQLARREDTHFKRDLPDGRLLEDLWLKIRDHPSQASRELIGDLNEYRRSLLEKSVADPAELVQWLYENQGVRRFDASNRLFLLLVDRSNFFESWKLKRAKPLLKSRIHAYLDSISFDSRHQIAFNWEGSQYRVVSDAIFVVHP